MRINIYFKKTMLIFGRFHILIIFAPKTKTKNLKILFSVKFQQILKKLGQWLENKIYLNKIIFCFIFDHPIWWNPGHR